MTSGYVKEQNLERQFEKQMGCMAGFLHIFDRHHIVTGKRLPPSSVGDSASESEKSAPPSPAVSGDLGKPVQQAALRSPAVDLPPKSPLPLPIFEKTRRPWKFSKEAPRLSLDSRATMDAKGGLHPKSVVNLVNDTKDGGQQCRSPSVIAKLMGLDQLPDSSGSEIVQTPELRRSASESRVSKDLFQSRFISDGSGFHQSHSTYLNNSVKDNMSIDAHYADPRNNSLKKCGNGQVFEGMKGGFVNSTPQWRAPQPRKSFFDSGDVFPEPKQSATIYGEIEKRIRLRGIDEPSKDLEKLKQILEALQLKGLLHSKPPSQQNHLRHRNFVYDESPIVLMKPTRSSSSMPINRRMGNENDYSPSNARNQPRGGRRSYNLTGETLPSPSPRREKSLRSPTRSGKSPTPPTRSNSPVKSKPSFQRRANESPPPENRKASPVRSPKLNTRKPGAGSLDRTTKSKKHEKEKISTIVITEDEYSSISGSSIATSTDTERSRADEFKEGKNLLERCDKLLHSIAEMAAADMQPSPVSVLDSSFYKDDSFTPSPVTTRLDMGFKDEYGELEEETWSPVISPIRSKFIETSDDSDFLYVSDILRALHHLMEDSDVFLVLEKQQYINGNDMSDVSRLQRKLIFDTINEIVGRSERLPPLDKVWSEFQRIRENDTCEDLFETICSVLKKDLVGDAIFGWGNCHVEGSEMVLDIERLIFKDMVCEIIGDLSSFMMTRRKLVF
ncbi:hypothetical protein ACS0TY_013137 [Phlomoides rotata]